MWLATGRLDSIECEYRKLDEDFFHFCPYLEAWLDFADCGSEGVVQVGLGFGAVVQKLMEVGAKSIGLDVAESPVRVGLVVCAQKEMPKEAYNLASGDETTIGDAAAMINSVTDTLCLWTCTQLVIGIHLAAAHLYGNGDAWKKVVHQLTLFSRRLL